MNKTKKNRKTEKRIKIKKENKLKKAILEISVQNRILLTAVILLVISIFILLIINNVQKLLIIRELDSNARSSFGAISMGVSQEVYTFSERGRKTFEDLSFKSSPDGKQFAYVSYENNREQVVLNGVVGPAYDKVKFILFSPDSSHFVYGVRDHGKEFIVLDGKEGEDYDWIFLPYLFSSNGNYFIYKVRNSGDGEAIVINGQRSKWQDRVYAPVISDDGYLIYYSVNKDKIFRSSFNVR